MRAMTNWDTKCELGFLKRLGTEKITVMGDNRPSRRSLLNSYRQSMGMRTDWGCINKKLIETYIDSELKKNPRSSDYNSAGNWIYP